MVGRECHLGDQSESRGNNWQKPGRHGDPNIGSLPFCSRNNSEVAPCAVTFQTRARLYFSGYQPLHTEYRRLARSPGNFAIFPAIRLASSSVSTFADGAVEHCKGETAGCLCYWSRLEMARLVEDAKMRNQR